MDLRKIAQNCLTRVATRRTTTIKLYNVNGNREKNVLRRKGPVATAKLVNSIQLLTNVRQLTTAPIRKIATEEVQNALALAIDLIMVSLSV